MRTQVERCAREPFSSTGWEGHDFERCRLTPQQMRALASEGRTSLSRKAFMKPAPEHYIKYKRPPSRAASIPSAQSCYGITPAGACGAGPAVVAAAASFKIR